MPIIHSFAVAIGLVASTLSVYPHQLAYFNELAGGAENGHTYLLHSNLDWGQDLLHLIQWQRNHFAASGAFYWLRCPHDSQHLGLRGSSLHDANGCERLVDRVEARDKIMIPCSAE